MGEKFWQPLNRTIFIAAEAAIMVLVKYFGLRNALKQAIGCSTRQGGTYNGEFWGQAASKISLCEPGLFCGHSFEALLIVCKGLVTDPRSSCHW